MMRRRDRQPRIRRETSMQQDDVSQVLNDPLAQELLDSNIPARLAYTGRDGAPRAIPIAFDWTGTEFVICTPPYAAKVAAIEAIRGSPSPSIPPPSLPRCWWCVAPPRSR